MAFDIVTKHDKMLHYIPNNILRANLQVKLFDSSMKVLQHCWQIDMSIAHMTQVQQKKS